MDTMRGGRCAEVASEKLLEAEGAPVYGSGHDGQPERCITEAERSA
jgi:hypothetical protein